MTEINSQQAFQQALADLPVKKQRQIGAKFIRNVLDLTSEPRFRDAVILLEKPELTAEELLDGYHSIHALYVQTHPRSDLSQLDYARQAEHFVAEACLVCFSPVYEETEVHHLAEKAAMYCCMARTCAGIRHDEEAPQLAQSQEMLAQEIKDQHKLLSEFLGRAGP
ncbi:MAG: hypothetical protein PVJ47_08095 [Thiohalocapsa sp.]|jgi:hypothetical protein